MKTYFISGKAIHVDDDIGVQIDGFLSESPDRLRIAYKTNGDIDSVLLYVTTGKWVRLHRFIMGVALADSDLYIDHIDGNVLNNQASNLRFCTNAQNQMNARPHRDKKTGLPKGVTITKYNPNFPYQVRVSVLGTRIQVGYFATVEQAERAYKITVEGLHGQFAYHTSRGEK